MSAEGPAGGGDRRTPVDELLQSSRPLLDRSAAPADGAVARLRRAARRVGTPASEAWYAEQRAFETRVREAIAHLSRQGEAERAAREDGRGVPAGASGSATMSSAGRTTRWRAALADALERLRHLEAGVRAQAIERTAPRRGGAVPRWPPPHRASRPSTTSTTSPSRTASGAPRRTCGGARPRTPTALPGSRGRSPILAAGAGRCSSSCASAGWRPSAWTRPRRWSRSPARRACAPSTATCSPSSPPARRARSAASSARTCWSTSGPPTTCASRASALPPSRRAGS